ncbi:MULTISPECIES: MarR family winged helix-turn-helix transcriptional regulator [Streptomyces]|uniref:MarR family winged helix-turn-helix transcriptional regulator n=1 Tax=Streptomyces evansiae TaxID=3075535 RepID=A0ABU2R3I8_9ACTN|nr:MULTISPECIES: MarR family winged helix-turn-helix transcriptional regulator [unclassified Streptomyces]MDT0411268.1 MarR family winged helix-turn-helix transcriptional regulator [Streptomyces sp. DSM 41979]MYQ60345.1 MarR family transcriptional regulator [Streptomyces sp. SID4926]WEH31100.1 MarR family winged helix-turn-helix transcriptional regulator [Streptomyces sp. AM 3-1-1]SCD82711.1 DNA-binding transcriptional regulator, MarR family [Streptomyces sp. DfronAA-171]
MAHRPVLSAEEEDAWTQLHLVAQLLPAVMDQRLRRDAGLGHFDYAVLLTLYRAPERTAAMTGLVEITSGSFSRLSHTVTRLEGRGLVTRERRGSHRYVSLTGEGRDVFLTAAAGHMDEIREQVLDHLSPEEVRALGDLLRPIATRLRANAPRG